MRFTGVGEKQEEVSSQTLKRTCEYQSPHAFEPYSGSKASVVVNTRDLSEFIDSGKYQERHLKNAETMTLVGSSSFTLKSGKKGSVVVMQEIYARLSDAGNG